MPADLPIGTKIRFLATLTDGPNEDHPIILYARKGELGVINGHGLMKQLAEALLAELADRGQIVEGGWKAFELLTGLKGLPEGGRSECRDIFFSGAQHVFGCIVGMLDEGKDATEKDLDRMAKLHAELQAFAEELKTRRPGP